MDWERLRQKILKQNYPTEEEIEEAQEKYKEISNFIEENFNVKTKFCGSTARKTFMKGHKDIDIFILFSEEISKEELERKGLEIGQKVFEHFGGNYRKEYAEHPYTKGEINDLEVEIVPCYDLPIGEIKSSVDRTPHHTEWCLNNLAEKQRKEVVILKTFLKTNELYGSSLKVQGFSGYLCEILIAKYGSFRKLIQNAQNWDKHQTIDIENHHKNNIPRRLRDKFSENNLTVIDPTDPERNVAAVLSKENYAKFTYNSMKFAQEPGIDKFQTQEHQYTNTQIRNEIDKRGTITTIKFPAIDNVEDILYPQLRKTVRRLAQIIKDQDFQIYSKGFHVSKDYIRIYFETDDELPEIKELEGPAPFHGKKHVMEFEEKYSNTWIEGQRLKTKVDRDYTLVKQFLISKIPRDQEKLRAKGIPEEVASQMIDHRFVDPTSGNQQWLNYLGKQFNIDNQ